MAKAIKAKKVVKIKKLGPNYRVFRLHRSLRLAISRHRDTTVEKYIEAAVDSQLAGLLQDQRVVVHGRHSGPKNPARLPLSEETLAKLREGSKLGIPSSVLLELCLCRHSATPAKRRKAH